MTFFLVSEYIVHVYKLRVFRIILSFNLSAYYLHPTIIGTEIPDLTTPVMGKYLHVAYVTHARVGNAFSTLDSISSFIYRKQNFRICLISFQ